MSTLFKSLTLAELTGQAVPQSESEPWIPTKEDLNPVKPTLVVGDVHGHFDRLEALLIQEGILGECSECDGSGVTYSLDDPEPFVELGGDCSACGGDGQCRINHDVEVIQVGDLGHFGQDASPTGDLMCYAYAVNSNWFDVVLWGNHDRAVIDSHHAFSGYLPPTPEVKHYMHGLYAMDKLKLAHAAHGFLITHAGLQAGWKQQQGIKFDKDDPVAFAEWINENDWWPSKESPRAIPVRYPPNRDPDLLTDGERSAMAVRDAISRRRGGNSPTGGILWRDEEEKLYPGMKQVYGHSAQRDGQFVVREQYDKRKTHEGTYPDATSFNVDIGGKYEEHLGAVWLPEGRLVRVDM